MDMLNSIAINISPPQRTFICSFTQGSLTDLLMEYILTESIRSELLISSVLKSQRLRETQAGDGLFAAGQWKT